MGFMNLNKRTTPLSLSICSFKGVKTYSLKGLPWFCLWQRFVLAALVETVVCLKLVYLALSSCFVKLTFFVMRDMVRGKAEGKAHSHITHLERQVCGEFHQFLD